MNIEYENGLPKGYLEKRKKVSLLYIYSIYLYCLFNLLVKYNILKFSDNRVYVVSYCLVIIISISFLCRSVMARRNFKGLTMYNHNDYKAFSKLEKILYTLPILISAIFIPWNMLTYLGVSIPAYLAVSRANYAPDADYRYDRDH